MAEAHLQSLVPGVRIDFDPLRGSPAHVRCVDGFLSGPGGAGRGVTLQSLEAVNPAEDLRPVKAFLDEHADLFGHGADMIAGRPPFRDTPLSKAGGGRTVAWSQEFEGVPVFEAALVAHVTGAEELLSVASTFVPGIQDQVRAWDPQHAQTVGHPPVEAAEAVALAAQAIEESSPAPLVIPLSGDPPGPEARLRFAAGLLPGIAQARLVWLPLNREAVSLCWCVELNRRRGGERYQVLIDARSGEPVVRRCLTLYAQEATYLVFTSDSPSPFSPGFSTPDTNQPPLVSRSRVTFAALNDVASPLGWIAAGENETRGNNVDAHLDLDGDDFPDLPRPHGVPFRVFAPAYDPTRPAEDNSGAAVVQLFYWCNWMHDRLYELGFTESAGNYQKDNLGRGGIGGDPVLADAQDGSGVNNANFTPAPDGEPGRIQMYVFDGASPSRDGDLDAEIILHEYTHGLSTRLVGAGVGMSSVQAGGMGEGWSDFYALSLLSQSGDDPDACYAMGGYVTQGFFGLQENYYFGIRRYPYSTDLTKNPLTFKDIDSALISEHAGVPRSPVFPFSTALAGEVHNQGEVWCVTLWEVRSRLIHKHGFEAGNRLVLQLVTDGMKLSPPNPNFLQARDAILQADLLLTHGANHPELWAAFARRGMGFSAVSPPSTSTSGVVEAYDLPDALGIEGLANFLFSGAVSGPAFVDCQSLVVTNQGPDSLSWVVGTQAEWLQVDPVSGTLEPGGATTVHFCLDPGWVNLSGGRYQDELVFSNLVTGIVQRRPVELRILQFTSLPFSDDFESGALRPEWFLASPEWGRIQVTTLGGPHGGDYQMVMDSNSDGLPARNEATLGLDLRGWTNVTLRFWAKEFSDEPNPPPPNPFRDGADFDGVAISVDGVWWYEVQSLRQLTATNREFVVNLDVPVLQYGLEYGSHFQVRFNQFDNYPVPVDGIGIDDVRIDGSPVRRYEINVPDAVLEGDLSSSEAAVVLFVPPAGDVTFALAADPPGEVEIPPSVTVGAGQTRGVFPVRALDNHRLDGTRSVVLRASAPEYFGPPAGLQINDDETASLSLTAPAVVDEGSGVLEQAGLVIVDQVAAGDLLIGLKSSDPARLSVPGIVVIPAGADRVAFDIQAPENARIEGPAVVSLTAEVPRWGSGHAEVLVRDNDPPELGLVLPGALGEGFPPLTASVTLAGTLPTNVVVSLEADPPGQLLLPATVMVPAGQRSAPFPLAAADNAVADGPRTASIGVRADGFAPATGSVRVLDDETPAHLYAPTPPDGSDNQPSRITLGWLPGFGEILSNGDFERGDLGGWSVASSTGRGFVISDGSVNPDGPDIGSPPFAGGFYALLAQDTPGKHSLWHDVEIPADALSATLSWAQFIHNHAPEFYDPSQSFRVEVRSPGGRLLAVPFKTVPGDVLITEWKAHDFDLTPFRGQRIRLMFAEEDELGFINVGIDSVSVQLGTRGATGFEVYLGTDSTPSGHAPVALTTNASVTVSGLEPSTSYYWQVVAVKDAARTAGPVWSFATRDLGVLDHFEWSNVPPAAVFHDPIPAAVVARDAAGFQLTTFSDAVDLSAFAGPPSAGALVISELFLSGTNFAEFSSVLGVPLDIGGWRLCFYDLRRWPAPRSVFTVPPGTTVPPGGVFTVSEGGRAPGRYPAFMLGEPLSWGVLAIGAPTALLVLDAQTNVVDFVCALDADPAAILDPVRLSPGTWFGAPLPPLPMLGNSWQRFGSRNYHAAGDWRLVPATPGVRNDGLADVFPRSDLLGVAPSRLSGFHAGRWDGTLVVEGAGPAITLMATNAEGRAGFSDPVAIRARDKVELLLTGLPTRVFVDSEFSIQYTVTNSGPAPSPSTLFRDQLPPGATLVAATSTRGSCSVAGLEVQCLLDPLPAGGTAVIRLRMSVAEPGGQTNRCSLEPQPADPVAGNPIRADVWDVQWPYLVIRDTTVTEGDSGTNMATFRVQLSAPTQREVRVAYQTENGTALAGADYVSTQGILVFAPGQTLAIISVPVLGDTVYEDQETFLVRLAQPVNALVGDPTATCKILEDDLPPQIVVDDVTVVEGPPGGAVVAAVPVRLTTAVGTPVLMTYFTQPGTALEVSDFIPQRGLLQFNPGVTRMTVSIPIVGDRRPEPEETFTLVVTNVSGADAGRPVGTITIVDDDESEIAAISWAPLVRTQQVAQPLNLTLSALDSRGRVVPSYQQPLTLSALASNWTVSLPESTNKWGFPFRTYFHDARSQFLYSPSQVGGAGTLAAMAFRIDRIPGQTLEAFRLQLRETSAEFLESPEWETSQWTSVHDGPLQISEPGWAVVPFTTGFEYTGVGSLMVDMTFDNDFYTEDGLCQYQETAGPTARLFETDSAFGDPRLWAGSSPPARLTNRVPVVRFSLEQRVTAGFSGPAVFQNGVWTGQVSFPDPHSNIRLKASTLDGYVAVSDTVVILGDGGGGSDQPQITGIAIQGQDVLLEFAGLPDRLYQLEATDHLDRGPWVPVGPPVTGSPGGVLLTDVGGAPRAQRFYRIRSL